MPRQARLDAPGTLHHVIIRGIEKRRIVDDDEDRRVFIGRLGDIALETDTKILAWSLMTNHVHILLRSGLDGLPKYMRRFLTGYALRYNRRHKRCGHLFQNRYKSVVCEDDPYFLEITRYIHLNPLRVGIVGSIKALNKYLWAGHSAIMGRVKRDWQDTETVLGSFGRRRKEAILKYERYVKEGIKQGRRPDLVGGGLIRSLGGWPEVVSLRKRGIKVASDERILGSGEFIEGIISEAEERQKETLRFPRKIGDLRKLLREIKNREGINERQLRVGGKKREVVRARRIFSQLAVKKMGFSGAEIARFLGLTTSAVNRLTNSEELPEIKRYIA